MDEEEKENNFKMFLNDTGTIEFFIDKIDILRKGKEKIMNKFAELKEKRGPDGLAIYEEKILLGKILYLYKDQIAKEYEKKKKKKMKILIYYQMLKKKIIKKFKIMMFLKY